jgi:hypothetical protein
MYSTRTRDLLSNARKQDAQCVGIGLLGTCGFRQTCTHPEMIDTLHPMLPNPSIAA